MNVNDMPKEKVHIETVSLYSKVFTGHPDEALNWVNKHHLVDKIVDITQHSNPHGAMYPVTTVWYKNDIFITD